MSRVFFSGQGTYPINPNGIGIGSGSGIGGDSGKGAVESTDQFRQMMFDRLNVVGPADPTQGPHSQLIGPESIDEKSAALKAMYPGVINQFNENDFEQTVNFRKAASKATAASNKENIVAAHESIEIKKGKDYQSQINSISQS